MLQEFDNDVLDLVKQKPFYPYEYVSDFLKFQEKLPIKETFYSSLFKRLITNNVNMFLIFEIKLK